MAYRLNGTDPFLRCAIGAFNGYAMRQSALSGAWLLKRNAVSAWHGVHTVDTGAATNYFYPLELNPSNQLTTDTTFLGWASVQTFNDITNWLTLAWSWDGSSTAGNFIWRWKIGAGAWSSETETPTSGGAVTAGSAYRHVFGNEAALGDDADFDIVCGGLIKSNLSQASIESLTQTDIASWDAVFTGAGAMLIGFDAIGTRVDRAGNGADELSRSGGITLVSDPPGWSWGTTFTIAFPRNPLAEMLARGGQGFAQAIQLIRPPVSADAGTPATQTITAGGASFAAAAAGATPAPQPVSITAGGASFAANAAGATPVPQPVTVTAGGTAWAAAAAGASPAPQPVSVTGGGARFEAAAAGATPAPQVVTVAGGGAAFQVASGGGTPVSSISITGGGATFEVRAAGASPVPGAVSLTAGGATFAIAAGGATPTPQPVSVTVGGATFAFTAAGASPVPQPVSITARGASFSFAGGGASPQVLVGQTVQVGGAAFSVTAGGVTQRVPILFAPIDAGRVAVGSTGYIDAPDTGTVSPPASGSVLPAGVTS